MTKNLLIRRGSSKQKPVRCSSEHCGMVGKPFAVAYTVGSRYLADFPNLKYGRKYKLFTPYSQKVIHLLLCRYCGHAIVSQEIEVLFYNGPNKHPDISDE